MSPLASLRRIFALTKVRNLEFLRDVSSLGWNIILPIVLVFGLAMVFTGEGKPLYKVGVVTKAESLGSELHPFLGTKYIDFFIVDDAFDYLDKVRHHKLDMLIDLKTHRYWVNESSPKGYTLERMLAAEPYKLERSTVNGDEIRYVDWLVPGILGMNMMFSCLFGVGYVIVRYRKNGYLKRLNATPLTAFEFISAQVLSRLILIMAITTAIFLGTEWTLGLRMEGSHFALFVFALLGCVAMISMGLMVSARVTSEELAGGLLNALSWPMMVLSGVWFSMEGTSEWLQLSAEIFPMTHFLVGVRAIMLDGASLADLLYPMGMLAGMSFIFMLIGAGWFKWRQE